MPESILAGFFLDSADFEDNGFKRRRHGLVHRLRLMTFDFALGQLRANLKDIAARSQDLAGLSGTAIPWLRNLTGWAKT